MKENTVLLDVKEYNNLRDFKKSVEDGKYRSVSLWSCEVFFMDGDVLVNDLEERISELININKILKKSVKNETRNEIAKLSLWRFIKKKYIRGN